MKKSTSSPHIIRSVSELHNLFALPKPDHPLVSVIDFSMISFKHSDVWLHFAHDFYCVVIKRGVNGKFKYGQNDYDFDEGMMTCTKPGQVFSVTEVTDDPVTGYMLVFKPEFIRHHALGKLINNYGFFSYSVREALHLSEKEDTVISSLLNQMQQEIHNNIDHYSQDVIVSHIELLLNYANRFYNRQFITRKSVNSDMLSMLEQLLSDYFNSGKAAVEGLPKVQYLAKELAVTPNYLSDMLRNLTGQSAQQYIHNHLIEKAKELLSTTNLSVSEIAYQLGFGYSQSFSKLFKSKTSLSPLEFRQSFN